LTDPFEYMPIRLNASVYMANISEKTIRLAEKWS
jgi:hypothetical protein